MAGYPIDLDGNNFYAGLDNRDANGGCFVGRDVHSNPGKDLDGAETPSHLNPIGQWLQANVANDTGTMAQLFSLTLEDSQALVDLIDAKLSG